MESGAITDAQITGSSKFGSNFGWGNARLNHHSFWGTKIYDAKPWILVDLSTIMTVKGVATQGREKSSVLFCVTKYKLQYSNDGQTFTDYKEERETRAKVMI